MKDEVIDMELVLDKKCIISESGSIPDEYYEKETDNAITLISLSIIRELFENGLLSKAEYDYILDKYKP